MYHQLRRNLTEKEQLFVEAVERRSPGMGAVVASNLSNPKSDWAETIAAMTLDEAIAATEFVGNTSSRCNSCESRHLA
jgi:hypothetical protein